MPAGRLLSWMERTNGRSVCLLGLLSIDDLRCLSWAGSGSRGERGSAGANESSSICDFKKSRFGFKSKTDKERERALGCVISMSRFFKFS